MKKSHQNFINRQGFLLVIVAAVFLEITSILQYSFAKKGMREEADKRAEAELQIAQLKVEKVTQAIEATTAGTAWVLSRYLSRPDQLSAVEQLIMDKNPVIQNAFAAFIPGYYPEKGRWFEQVLSRRENGYELLIFDSEDHDYLSTDWFQNTVESGEGFWSEPYFDQDGVKIMVVTYAVPLRDTEGNTVGIFGVDVAVNWLSEIVEAIQPYPDSFGAIKSPEGQTIACPPETLAVEKPLRYQTDLTGTDWKMSLVIPEEEIYGSVKRLGMLILLLQILGLGILILIVRFTAKSQKQLEQEESRRQRMEDELKVASDIQMSMIPKIFPPFPDRNDIDMAAIIDPAKEVGGDLYDFFIHDEKLFFCIGDVSGKGVPAALVMAVTRSLFRTISLHHQNAKGIVTSMNNALASANETNMFVTLFCGILDMQTGLLNYCNAGHNAPVLLSDDKYMLPVVPNLALGILEGVDFQEQHVQIHYDDAIFLYTDGLTEAENIHAQLFGEERMREVLTGRKASIEHLQNMQKAVHEFVGEAPQSDDLTMLFIHYLNKGSESLYQLTITNDVQEIPKVSQLVEEIGEQRGLDVSLVMSLNLALEEAVTNVVVYAYPEGQEGKVDVEAILRPGSVEFTLIDSGKAFDPTSRPDPDLSLGVEDRPIGGLGIFLVRQIMDKVEYERRDGKNYLRMTKNI